MSCSRVRARLSTTGAPRPEPRLRTASKSPGEDAANPASITSTPSASSCCAIAIFSSTFIVQPGDCSPSRSVVSKIRTQSPRESFLLCAVMTVHSTRRELSRPQKAKAAGESRGLCSDSLNRACHRSLFEPACGLPRGAPSRLHHDRGPRRASKAQAEVASGWAADPAITEKLGTMRMAVDVSGQCYSRLARPVNRELRCAARRNGRNRGRRTRRRGRRGGRESDGRPTETARRARKSRRP